MIKHPDHTSCFRGRFSDVLRKAGRRAVALPFLLGAGCITALCVACASVVSFPLWLVSRIGRLRGFHPRD